MDSYLQSLKGCDVVRVEMVCLGNICRSPMAAAVLANRAKEIASPRLIVTSSGTSQWHVGESAHQLSEKTWKKAGYTHSHSARQFQSHHFDECDIVLAMDLSNHADIINLARSDEDRVKVSLLRSFDPIADSLEVPDPWGNEIDAYEKVLTMIERSVTGFLASLQ